MRAKLLCISKKQKMENQWKQTKDIRILATDHRQKIEKSDQRFSTDNTDIVITHKLDQPFPIMPEAAPRKLCPKGLRCFNPLDIGGTTSVSERVSGSSKKHDESTHEATMYHERHRNLDETETSTVTLYLKDPTKVTYCVPSELVLKKINNHWKMPVL